jgi:hypothetical protein
MMGGLSGNLQTTLRFEERFMLHKCANPACPSVFRSLSHGKLFLLETENSATTISDAASLSRRERSARRVERYWLCDCCSSLLTLTFERGRGMITVPLPASNTRLPGAHLTLMQPAARGYRAEQS